MRRLFFFTILFCSSTAFCQLHTDLKEYGFKGQVKRVITNYYDSLTFDQQQRNNDENLYQSRVVYTYHKDGNFDSIYYFLHPSRDPSLNYPTFTVYRYPDDNRTAVQLNENNQVTDNISYQWLTDSTYERFETPVNGPLHIKTHVLLYPGGRYKSGGFTVYDPDGKPEQVQENETTLNESGLLIHSREKSLLTGSATELDYAYSGFDKAGNPTRIIIISHADGKIIRIMQRIFEYY